MSKTLSLAFVRQSYRPDGGAERILERTLAAMAGRDIQPVVIARDWPGSGSGSAGLEVIRDPGRYRSRSSRLKGFAEFVCSTVTSRRFDLVQSHERIACCDIYRAGDGVHGEWLAQRARTRAPLARVASRLSPYHAQVLDAEKTLFASPRLKAVICNSRMVKDEIRHWFDYPEERLHVIYNGVDQTIFSPATRVSRQALLEQTGITGQPFVFLFVGSGFERKGLATALQALARTGGNSRLMVIGVDKNVARYQRLAGRLGIASRVFFLGRKNDVSKYYGAADALLLPTLYDPFPNVCTEAFASGLPVITSNKCGAAELIVNGGNGYVADALDVAAFAENMKAVMEHGRDHYCDKAVATTKDLTLNNMVDKIVSLYGQVLERS
ncbi:MAG: glycosyl transferase family 1 [Gammaproteobacteria bacterium]|nr:MAG: glycosyl transferase family 1 [Gammaproteobacteria bacterium]